MCIPICFCMEDRKKQEEEDFALAQELHNSLNKEYADRAEVRPTSNIRNPFSSDRPITPVREEKRRSAGMTREEADFVVARNFMEQEFARKKQEDDDFIMAEKLQKQFEKEHTGQSGVHPTRIIISPFSSDRPITSDRVEERRRKPYLDFHSICSASFSSSSVADMTIKKEAEEEENRQQMLDERLQPLKRYAEVISLDKLVGNHCCPICINDFTSGETILHLPCGHSVHTDACASSKWLLPAFRSVEAIANEYDGDNQAHAFQKTGGVCPFCNAKINQNCRVLQIEGVNTTCIEDAKSTCRNCKKHCDTDSSYCSNCIKAWWEI